MTTVYLDKRAGLLLTDSRITYTTPRALWNLFPLRSKEKYGITTQKSLYVHDRLFSAAGSVSEINKILNYLINGEIVIPDRKANCHCILISKDYCIHLGTFKGKFFKYVEFMDNDYVYSTGSGSPYMVDAKIHYQEDTLLDKIFSTFMKVKDHDPYSDDNINVYKL